MALEEPEIVVTGAGFVGLAFALAAHQQGFAVAVHDRRARPVPPTEAGAAVIAVNPASWSFLDSLGISGRLTGTFVNPYDQMEVYDGDGTGHIRFSAAEAGLEHLGNIVDQRALLAALADEAEAVGLPVHWETEVEGNLEPALLVAADGAHSATRERLGLGKVAWSYHQTATVCVAGMNSTHDSIARQWFRETGPLALLPLAEEHEVAVVWSSFEDMSGLPDEAFMTALEQACEAPPGTITRVTPRISFPLMHLQATQYVRHGVALLGDAAHAIHPLAGQGANLGFADAEALTREIAGARLEGRSIGDLTVLRRYERARRRDNYLAGLAMEGFHRLFTSRNPLLSLVRSRGLQLVDGNTTLKRLAVGFASGRV